ncbi:SMI1/KNR4 family protein [Oscillatoriales cyanobacterium LEGE 11467]|uniref:SMI1/KNR4 family protein n=1 Tax=Zarconia navalis LEGE 11467 TaxID=1828826 RepID=A0A928Z8N1_9CYAN|nr:SMI1/KNR4 family protein [Zarconia navalis]MBE9040749.1 SMI1/KNR4 family protein [Zarconia navalis LEGE 11467]
MNHFSEKMNSLGYDNLVHQEKEFTKGKMFKLEEILQAKLPTQYRQFLLDYGGCAIAIEEYVVVDYIEKNPRDGDECLVEVFFGIPLDTASDKQKLYDLFGEYYGYLGIIPSNLLPIATSCGNIICISFQGTNKGKVYLWEHEEEEMTAAGEPCTYSNVYLISHSFKEFIKSLKIQTEEEFLESL